MNWQRILYGVLLIFLGTCVSARPAPKHPKKPLFPKRHEEAKAVEAVPEPEAARSPDCTCSECKCDPCLCKKEVAEAPKPAATGRWVLVQRPVYGGFRGRQFQGYQKFWQWQGPVQATQTYSSCANGQCGR